MRSQLQDEHHLFTTQLFKQIEHLPLLIEKCTQVKQDAASLKEIQSFVEDIEVLLATSGADLDKQCIALTSEPTHEIVDDIE